MRKQSKFIAAGEFKAKCLHLMDEVKSTHISMTVTKRGIPMVKIVPLESSDIPSLFGIQSGTVVIQGDLLEPIDEAWDVDR